MCLRPDCGLCGIAMHGFKIGENIGRSPARNSRAKWLMYGRGIYFTSVSSKADYFSKLTAQVERDVAIAVFDTHCRCPPPPLVHPWW